MILLCEWEYGGRIYEHLKKKKNHTGLYASKTFTNLTKKKKKRIMDDGKIFAGYSVCEKKEDTRVLGIVIDTLSLLSRNVTDETVLRGPSTATVSLNSDITKTLTDMCFFFCK